MIPLYGRQTFRGGGRKFCILLTGFLISARKGSPHLWLGGRERALFGGQLALADALKWEIFRPSARGGAGGGEPSDRVRIM